MSDPILTLRGIVKEYGEDVKSRVLHGIDLDVRPGELLAVMGPSGSGKSTLLNIIGLLDRPTEGRVELLGRDTSALKDDELTRLRGQQVGFVFQFHHLINALSTVENVMAPLSLRDGRTKSEHRDKAMEMLDLVGLADRGGDSPRKLSGGQQQRVAIARALVVEPAIVLADEPTGNLDSKTSGSVFALMRGLNREKHMAFVIVTHDQRIADECERIVEIVDGRIARDTQPPRRIL
jgi:lipoprotein-releasing system ATP-binding protein